MQLARSYFVAQSIAIVAWWMLLWLRPDCRAPFWPEGRGDTLLLVFGLPDLLVAAGGSALSAVLLWRASTQAPLALFFTAGAMVYATLYCVAMLFVAPETWLATTLMIPAAAATTILAWMLRCPTEPS
ncbi:MAG: hypothetical protein KDC38_20685 [Planctomycetes bacterium]|nr:hypothetical protein [Planctomycetota bacterium]